MVVLSRHRKLRYERWKNSAEYPCLNHAGVLTKLIKPSLLTCGYNQADPF